MLEIASVCYHLTFEIHISVLSSYFHLLCQMFCYYNPLTLLMKMRPFLSFVKTLFEILFDTQSHIGRISLML